MLNCERTEAEILEGIEYDKNGTLLYHPDYHFAQHEPFTTDDLIYLSKYHEREGIRSISLALGRTVRRTEYILQQLKRYGLYDYYRALSFERWEQILLRGERNEFSDQQERPS